MVVREARPGQFVIVRLDEFAERIPLTICDADKARGTVTLIIQQLGRSTKDLCALKAGDPIRDVLGPLGNPTEIEKFGTVVIIGGGVGAAELYATAKALKEKGKVLLEEKGNKVIAIIGARNKSLIILENEFKAIADEVLITTDDGSYGIKGFVTDALKKVISEQAVNRIICCGPIPMMKAVTMTAKPHNIPTIVSLNAILLDATGMCGSCRCTIEGKTKFSCVDGPEFDGYKVDFDELVARNKRFLDEERRALEG
jgi:ferredoxin--NADP+ reductase